MVVLLVGLGNMGSKYLNVLDQIKSITKIIIVDKVCKEISINKKYTFYKNIKEIKDKNEINFAIISTPTNTHYNVFNELKNFCKNLLIEKPIFKDLNECNFFVKEISSLYNVSTGFIERFNPVVKFIKNNIDLNDIIKIDFLRYSKKPQQITDVGVDLDLGIHDIDLSFFILNKRYKNIKSLKKCYYKEDNKTLISSILIDYNNIICNIQSSWKNNSAKREIYITLKNNDKYKFDLIKKTYCKNSQETVSLEHNNQLIDQIQSFINIINNKNDNTIAGYENGIDALKVLLNENIN